jgi:hypothetical protein
MVIGTILAVASVGYFQTACTKKSEPVVSEPQATTVQKVPAANPQAPKDEHVEAVGQGAGKGDVGFNQNRSASTTEAGSQAPVEDSGVVPSKRTARNLKNTGFNQNRSNSTTESGSQAPATRNQ